MGESVRQMAKTISANLHGGCMYIYRGPQILYYLTNSCLPTRFAFSNHLSTVQESTALGIDIGTAVRRILVSRPTVILFAKSNYASEHPVTFDRVILHLATKSRLTAGAR